MAPSSDADAGSARDATAVSWTRLDPAALASPIETRLPYVECRLEHPDVEATRVGDTFFPSAVPYRLDGERRVFFWERALAGAQTPVEAWDGACVTTHGLVALSGETDLTTALLAPAAGGWEVVVDGTVVGDSTRAVLSAYDPPAIRLDASGDAVRVRGPDGATTLVPGDSVRLSLPRQTVRTDDGVRRVEPVLAVRFPGVRTLVHPSPDDAYALFPSFGCSLDSVPNPVAVPVSDGLPAVEETTLPGASLADRPFGERVLWQAFVATAFDPRREAPVELAQFDAGYLAVR